MRRSLYAATFQSILAETGMANIDPRWAEAWARLEWGTLDHLYRADLRRFVREMRPVLTDPSKRDDCERLADSYGL